MCPNDRSLVLHGARRCMARPFWLGQIDSVPGKIRRGERYRTPRNNGKINYELSSRPTPSEGIFFTALQKYTKTISSTGSNRARSAVFFMPAISQADSSWQSAEPNKSRKHSRPINEESATTSAAAPLHRELQASIARLASKVRHCRACASWMVRCAGRIAPAATR